MLFKKAIWTHCVQAIILGVLLALHISVINIKSEVVRFSDFFGFYQSARCFLQGESIYTPIPFYPSEDFFNRMTDKAKKSSSNCFPNMNCPLHTLFMAPFAMLPLSQAFWTWSLLSLAFGFMSVGLIVSQGMPLQDTTTSFLNISIILFSYFPTFANEIVGGQWGLCLLLLLALIWHTSRTGKQVQAGVILGIAMSLKIVFGIYLLYFLVRRKGSVWVWSLGTFCIMNIVGLLVFGIADYKQYALNLETVPQFINANWNASSAAFFSRIFGGAENAPLVMMPGLAHAMSVTCSILLIIGVIRSARSQVNDVQLSNFDLGFSFTTVSMLLISPVGWMYYFPILILPLLAIWNNAACLESAFKYRFLAVGFWLVSSIPTEYIPSVLKDLDEPLVWFTSAGYYFYALAAFSIIIICILHYKGRNYSSVKISKALPL